MTCNGINYVIVAGYDVHDNDADSDDSSGA